MVWNLLMVLVVIGMTKYITEQLMGLHRAVDNDVKRESVKGIAGWFMALVLMVVFMIQNVG